MSRETILSMNGTVALFTISFIHGDFFYFYFRDVALEKVLETMTSLSAMTFLRLVMLYSGEYSVTL